MTERLVAAVRDLSLQVVQQVAPNEVALFDAVWSGCEPWVHAALELDPGQWARVGRADSVPTSVGLIGGREALDLPAVKAITAITAGVSVLDRRRGATKADALAFAEEYSRNQGLYDEDVARAVGAILAANVEAVRKVTGAAVGGALAAQDGQADRADTAEGSGRTTAEFEAITAQGKEAVAEGSLEAYRERATSAYDVFIDETADLALVDAVEIDLDRTPRACLTYLILNRGRVCQHRELFRSISYLARIEDEARRTDGDMAEVVKHWVSRIVKAAGWSTEEFIRSSRGKGYQWVGKCSFCILRSRGDT